MFIIADIKISAEKFENANVRTIKYYRKDKEIVLFIRIKDLGER